MRQTEALRKRNRWTLFKKQKNLHFFMIPLTLWAFAIFYLPITGNIIAFEDYSIPKGLFNSPWVGFKHFANFLSNDYTLLLVRNTLAMSLMGLVFGTLAAITMAILINEISHKIFKKTIQTISYLPYFISMAVCANLFINLLGRNGPVNDILVSLGLLKEGYPFLEKEGLFWWILTIQNIWKTVGWNAIIYLAAIAGISDEIYEASFVDGAGRFTQLFRITLPSLLPTISILLILNSGYVIMGGFEQQFLMYNPMVMDTAEVINTYVYKRGMGGADYSFATAIGMLQSLASIFLLLIVNKTAKKLSGSGLW